MVENPNAPEPIIAIGTILKNEDAKVEIASRFLAVQKSSSDVDRARSKFKSAFDSKLLRKINERAFEEKQRILQGKKLSLNPQECFESLDLGNLKFFLIKLNFL